MDVSRYEKMLLIRRTLGLKWVIRPRRMSWNRHAAYMGETRNAYKIPVGKLQRKTSFADICLHEKTILN
jgi:hypothetical protein